MLIKEIRRMDSFINNNLNLPQLNCHKDFRLCDDGFFLKTTDGGNTWIAQSSGFSGRTLFKIQFVDSQNGFTTGKLLKTNNGGQSWQAIDAPGFSYGLHFIDKNDFVKNLKNLASLLKIISCSKT